MRTLVISLLVGLLVGGWLGYRLADGRCAQREHDVAVRYAEDANARLEVARRDFDAQAARTARQARRDALSEARRMKEAADYELLIARIARPECARDAESFDRLRDAIRSANARLAEPPAGVREGVRANPRADRPE